jgi:hypothetical protein
MIFCVPLETTLMLSSFAMCAAKLPMLGPWIDSGASMCGKKGIALRHFFSFFVSFGHFWSFFVFCVSF